MCLLDRMFSIKVNSLPCLATTIGKIWHTLWAKLQYPKRLCNFGPDDATWAPRGCELAGGAEQAFLGICDTESPSQAL